LRLFPFGGYGLALAALARLVFGAHDSYPIGLATKGGAQELENQTSLIKSAAARRTC